MVRELQLVARELTVEVLLLCLLLLNRLYQLLISVINENDIKRQQLPIILYTALFSDPLGSLNFNMLILARKDIPKDFRQRDIIIILFLLLGYDGIEIGILLHAFGYIIVLAGDVIFMFEKIDVDFARMLLAYFLMLFVVVLA